MIAGEPRQCAACTLGCDTCHDTSTSGCDKCKFFYRLENGTCLTNWRVWQGIAVTLVACLVAAYYLWRQSASSRVRGQPSDGVTRHEEFLSRSHGQPSDDVASHEEFLAQAGPEEQPVAALPSGLWKGYYTYLGMRHDVCEFTLDYDDTGNMRGDGVDDVGKYVINGHYSPSRLAFSKRYIARSTNTAGVVSYGNQGHTVEYRGELASSTLGGGFRGGWSIPNACVEQSSGEFHLWPAMDGWMDTEPDT
eukprot:gene24384-29639_t